MSSGLNDKQKRFCDEYLLDYNATQAAIRAGYSEKTAYSQGHDLLKKPEIESYLTEKNTKITNKLEISREKTMQAIARIAFADIRCLFNADGGLKSVSELTEAEATILASIDVEDLFAGSGEGRTQIGFIKKVKTWDKIKALEMLAKHFKIFDDAPKVPVTINVSNLSAADLKTLLELKKKAA